MDFNIRKILAILASFLPVLFKARKKNNEIVPEPANAITNVKFTFSNNAVSLKSADSNAVDLSDATILKIVYGVKDNGVTLPIIKKAEFMLLSTAAQATTINQKILTFKAGTTLSIRFMVLINIKGKVIAVASADEFIVYSPQGTLIMEREYDITGLEKN